MFLWQLRCYHFNNDPSEQNLCVPKWNHQWRSGHLPSNPWSHYAMRHDSIPVLACESHQDKDPHHQLTIKEQHNVDCDKLAKTFILNHPLQTTDMATPEFAIAEPHLKIAGKVICWQVLPALCQVAAAPAYWDYLCKHFTWTQSDLLNIQWETIKTSLNSFLCNNQWRLVLFLHDKLALRTSKFHPHLGSQLCPSCQWDPKDCWHFFECQHPECHWLFTNLKQLLAIITTKYSLHPVIFTTFWLGLLMIHNDIPFLNVSAKLLTILRSTVTAQTRLG